MEVFVYFGDQQRVSPITEHTALTAAKSLKKYIFFYHGTEEEMDQFYDQWEFSRIQWVKDNAESIAKMLGSDEECSYYDDDELHPPHIWFDHNGTHIKFCPGDGGQ